MRETRILLPMLSGCFATLGGLFGKIAGSYDFDSMDGILLKILFLILTITGNTIGCGLFVKALNASGSSLPPTIASAATSYLCSGIVGWLIFGEVVTATWWFGIFYILLGLITMYRSSQSSSKSIETDKKHN